jgi:hypothetical protein
MAREHLIGITDKMTRKTKTKKTAHWSSKGASIERAGKRWIKEEQRMRETGRSEQLYGTQETIIKRKKERAVKETKEWARTQYDEWQKTELEHVNDRERAYGETTWKY